MERNGGKMKRKKQIYLGLGIIIVPFIIMLCLHIGIALGRYFNININVPEIKAADWFMFAGSYLGGVLTLFGVLLTLRYERNIHGHQLTVTFIQEERNNISSLIEKLDLFGPSICYVEFTSALGIKEYNKLPDFSNVRNKIAEYLRGIYQSRTELTLCTDILFISPNCSMCKHPCRLSAIQNEFSSIYNKISKLLDETLRTLDAYIVDTYQNMLRDELISQYRQNIAECSAKGLVSNYSEKDIQTAEREKKDLTLQKTILEQKLSEVSQVSQNEFEQLLRLSREYSSIKIQNAQKKYIMCE